MKAKRFILMLLVALVSVTGAYAQMSFIKDVKVRVGAQGNYSDLTSEGYTVISGPNETYFDFNGGGTGGDYVYIGYKTTTNPNEAISDLAIVYNNSGTSTAYGSDDFLYGGSKTMMIGSKRYYLAPHSGGPDMNNRNDKHNNCVYLYYTRDVDTSDGMRLLTTLGGNRWGSRHTTVPTGWDSMIRGYMGNGQPTTTGGSNYVVTYDTERVFGDTNEAGGGDYTYILCNYVSGIYYVDIDGQKKFPNSITEITNTSSTLSAGGYIVRGTDVQTGTLTCNGAVNIILADGAKLTTTGQANNPGIQVSAAGSSLAIYGQMAQTGQLTAIGGTGASAIDGGSPGAASPIYVNTSLTVCADGNNPPTTFIDYTIGVDVSASLSGKRYATMRIPQNITVTLDRQGGTGGSEQVNVMEGSAMPTISVPTRTGYTFHGYYASQNGTGTKYYNADGTSAHKWDRTSTATLYAHWTANQYTVTFDMQNGIGGTESATATYDDAMPEITIPTREDYAFLGYFSQPYGRGTKYYNADGTSAQAWNVANNTTTLYAQWKLVRLHYIDADGSKKFITEFTEITNASSTTTLSSGWYIVYDADVQTHTLVCEGAVNLVLMDGAKLTATGDYFDAGIRVSAEGASLTIYGQQNQNGQLIATGGFYGAGIGGAKEGSGHDITINGGVITANGGFWGAGIGGGNLGTGHDITINGGVITAGGTDASAIGAGDRGSSSNIFINSSLILWADGSNPPTTIITHLPDEDVSNSLNGRTYAIVRNPANGVTITFDKQSGTGGTNQITVDEGSVMPDISVPERDGYAFVGYFSGPDGTGTKYYKCDGTSDQLWNQGENVTLYAYWTSPVPYIDADGTTKYAGIDKEITNETTTLRSGWYLVNDADVQTRTLVCEGDVHLILADGAKLTATGGNYDAGIRVSAEGASLTIYGQKNQTGQLIATGGYFGSGIGGAREGSGHDITINGGVITANGGVCGAGIGGGNWGTGHDITINGGVITAVGGTYASAIGAGDGGSSSNIHINAALFLKADENATPNTEIEHTSTVDLASALSGKQYATLALPTVTVNHASDMNANFSTFYHAYAAYTVPNEDATIYTASVETVNNETCLVLHKVEGNVIPANTAVILRTEESSTIDLQPCADASGISVPANSLSGANLPIDAPDNCYIMSYGQEGLGFYSEEQGNTLAAHEAFLIIQHDAPEFLVMLITVQPSGDITGTKMVVTKKNGDVTRFDANNIVKVECTTEKPAINKGKAKATINGNEVDVNWVQLWDGGPKFAEYNVGANSATDVGTTMTFTDATKTGADYVWGANWCTPSKNDMDELLLAAQGNSSSKVTCNYCEFTQGDGKWGFKFTGKEPGYTDNSVFFPTQGGDSFIGCADYWSATADGGRAWDMFLFYDGGGWRSDWLRYYQDGYCYVRPVLAMLEESSSERYVIVTKKDGTVTVFNFDEVQSVTWEMPAPEPEPEPTTGTAKATIGDDEVDVPWVQLWENGPKFAKYNVGVTDGKAESYGGYYAWGGSQHMVDDHNTGSEVLSGDNDTATKLWGNAWRMPTQAELQALLDNCDVEWTTVNDVDGRIFTGKGDYASNSVFLPAAGRRYGGSVVEQGTEGGYWSSTPEDSPYAYDLDIDSGGQLVDYYYRGIGYSVRAIYDPQ